MKAISEKQILREHYTNDFGEVKTIGIIMICDLCNNKVDRGVALDIKDYMTSKHAHSRTETFICGECLSLASEKFSDLEEKDNYWEAHV